MAPKKRARQAEKRAEDAGPAPRPQPSARLTIVSRVPVTFKGTPCARTLSVAGVAWTLQVAPKVNGSNNMMTGTLMAVQDLSKAPPELRQLWQSSSVSLALHRAQGGVLRASPERQPPVAFNDIGALSSSFVFGEAETVLAPSYGAVSADGAATVEVSFKVPAPISCRDGDVLLCGEDGGAFRVHSHLLRSFSRVLRGLLSTQQDGLRQAALDCKQPLVVPLETTSSEQLHLLLQALCTPDLPSYLSCFSLDGLRALGEVLHAYDFTRLRELLEHAMVKAAPGCTDLVALLQWTQRVEFGLLETELLQRLVAKACQGEPHVELKELDQPTLLKVAQRMQRALSGRQPTGAYLADHALAQRRVGQYGGCASLPEYSDDLDLEDDEDSSLGDSD